MTSKDVGSQFNSQFGQLVVLAPLPLTRNIMVYRSLEVISIIRSYNLFGKFADVGD